MKKNEMMLWLPGSVSLHFFDKAVSTDLEAIGIFDEGIAGTLDVGMYDAPLTETLRNLECF